MQSYGDFQDCASILTCFCQKYAFLLTNVKVCVRTQHKKQGFWVFSTVFGEGGKTGQIGHVLRTQWGFISEKQVLYTLLI